jgi:hypothetical protein
MRSRATLRGNQGGPTVIETNSIGPSAWTERRRVLWSDRRVTPARRFIAFPGGWRPRTATSGPARNAGTLVSDSATPVRD